MTIVKKEYMTIFDKGEADAKYHFPDWFIMSPPKFRKIVRVLGITACYKDTVTNNFVDLPRHIRLTSNLTSDFPSNQSFTPPVFHPKFNFVMMVNNYNSVKEFDITHNNINYLSFEYNNEVGGVFEGPSMDIVIELEIMITSDED